jgi:hypothetical protein
MATATDLLTTYLQPIGEEMTPQLARRILSATPSDELVARVQELGDKANEGMLTVPERAEYEQYVDVGDAIGVLKAKARRLLSETSD